MIILYKKKTKNNYGQEFTTREKLNSRIKIAGYGLEFLRTTPSLHESKSTEFCK